MTAMTPRERLAITLAHREPDRVPIDFGGTTLTSINVNAYRALREHLGLEAATVEVADLIQQLARVDEDVASRFHADVRYVVAPDAGPVDVFDDGDCYAFFDRFGSRLHMPKDGGLYYDWVEPFPIPEPTQEALDAYRWPRCDSPEAVASMRDAARRLWETTDFGIVAEVDMVRGILEEPTHLMGFQKFYETLALDTAFADRLMGRLTDLYAACCEQVLREVGPYIQAFLFMDDLAGQDGWLVNPDLYRRYVKPRQKRIFDIIHRMSEAKVLYHGCGAAFEQIADLIDIGVEIFNPVQVSARGMDTARLKRTYGRDIVFWGGGVDTQRVLPFGSPVEVRQEVRRRIDDLAPGGGFVFAVVHNVQAFVPPHNVVAAFDEAVAYGTYPTAHRSGSV
jgi:uroporphyrinogen decarboxylase